MCKGTAGSRNEGEEQSTPLLIEFDGAVVSTSIFESILGMLGVA